MAEVPGPDTDSARWEAANRGARKVLAVARTLTSAIRVLEALDGLRGDHRIKTAFTVEGTSAYSDGAEDLLRRAGARIIPWESVGGHRFDLAVTASENVDLEPLDCPVLVLPHGIGFHKFVPDARGTGQRISGLVGEKFLRSKHVTMVVTHPRQAEYLRAAGGEGSGGTVVALDPSRERLRAGRKLRELYRRELGVAPRQSLVLTTSTWGPQSLVGRHPRVNSLLLARLPYDSYRVAAVLHPNVWSREGAWQVRTETADAVDGGLILVPPDEGWHAAMLAADCVVGDHGSVTLYAAALGLPVLLGAFGDGTAVVPGTPMAALGAEAPRLDLGGDLSAQIDAVAAQHAPDRYAAFAADLFTPASDDVRTIAEAVSARLGLAPLPSAAQTRAAAPLRGPARRVGAFLVHTTVTDGGVDLHRFPAAAALAIDRDPGPAHLSAAEGEPDRMLVENAAVVWDPQPAGDEEAAATAARLLGAYPGCRIAAAATAAGCTLALRDGRMIDAAAQSGTLLSPCLLAGAVYALLVAGRSLVGTVLCRVGGAEHKVALSPAL
ncbi:hypothetical protein [Nocardiopsis coralliicola]